MKNILVEINDHNTTVRTGLGALQFVRRRDSWHGDHPIVDIQFTNGLIKMSDADLRALVDRGTEALKKPTFNANPERPVV